MQKSQESNTSFRPPPHSPSFCLFVGDHIWKGELFLASTLSLSYYFSFKLPSCHHLFDTDVVHYFYSIFLFSCNIEWLHRHLLRPAENGVNFFPNDGWSTDWLANKLGAGSHSIQDHSGISFLPPLFRGAVSSPLWQLIYSKATDIKLSACPKTVCSFAWNIDTHIIKCGGGSPLHRGCCCLSLKWNTAATQENLWPTSIKQTHNAPVCRI